MSSGHDTEKKQFVGLVNVFRPWHRWVLCPQSLHPLLYDSMSHVRHRQIISNTQTPLPPQRCTGRMTSLKLRFNSNIYLLQRRYIIHGVKAKKLLLYLYTVLFSFHPWIWSLYHMLHSKLLLHFYPFNNFWVMA